MEPLKREDECMYGEEDFTKTLNFSSNIWNFNIYEKNELHFINPVCDDSQQITIIVIFRVTESYWVETIISGKKKLELSVRPVFV